MEHALSEVASSINSSYVHKTTAKQTWILQLQIWLHLGKELHRKSNLSLLFYSAGSEMKSIQIVLSDLIMR